MTGRFWCLSSTEVDRLQRSADSFLSLLSLLSRPGPWTAQSLQNYFWIIFIFARWHYPILIALLSWCKPKYGQDLLYKDWAGSQPASPADGVGGVSFDLLASFPALARGGCREDGVDRGHTVAPHGPPRHEPSGPLPDALTPGRGRGGLWPPPGLDLLIPAHLLAGHGAVSVITRHVSQYSRRRGGGRGARSVTWRLVSVLSPSWQTVWPAPAPRGDCEEQTALTGLSPSLPALCGPPTRHNCLTSPDLSCNTNISPVEIICSKTPNKILDERSIKILLTASFRWYETNPNNYVPSRNSSSLKNFYFKLIIRSIITLSNFKSVLKMDWHGLLLAYSVCEWSASFSSVYLLCFYRRE